jgi:hypothetical protein
MLSLNRQKENYMKTARIILISIMVLSPLIRPAQANSENMGFVPLLTKVDPGIPLRTQAIRAFNALMPLLVSARKNGTILEFTPEFSAGLLIIKFAIGNHASDLGGIPILDNIHAALAMVPHKKLVKQLKLSNTYNPQFYIDLYGISFSIYGLGPEDHVIGSLRDKTGRILSNYEGDADNDGYIYDSFDCCGSYSTIIPGYKLTFKVTSPSGTPRGTYVSNAPNITFDSIDKTKSIVSGSGPVGKVYRVYWYHRNLDSRNTYLYIQKKGRISSSAKWTVDFATTKFRGGDELGVFVDQTTHITFSQWIYIPSIMSELGSNYCIIWGFPRQAAVLNIVHKGIHFVFTGRFDNDGSFSATLEDSAGFPVFLAAGDSISGTDIPLYTLPIITVTVNFSTDIVSGKAPAKKYFGVYVKPD